MDPLVVRVAEPADAAVLSELLQHYHERTEAEKVAHGLQESGPLAPRYAAEVADPAAAFAGATVLLARRAGAALGMVMLSLDEAEGEIKRLWVEPAGRGAGVGSALIAAAASRAAAVGAASLRLSVWDWRDDALRLYAARGFVPAPSWESRERLVCLRLLLA